MASVVQNSEIMLIIMLLHEFLQFPVKAVLGAALASLRTRALVGQINDFGIVSKLLFENGLEGSHLELSETGRGKA